MIDEQAALESLDGQRELLCDLALMFCEDSPIVLNELRQAIDASDSFVVRHAVHSLKGLASTFFAHKTVELAQRLELEAASGNLASLADGGAEKLADSIAELAQELKSRGLCH